MCRHLAYVGPPVALADLLLAPPHSLVRQAREARHMDAGTSNPDGFGVGWFAPGASRPERYRSAAPIWRDERLPGLAARARARAALAAVRLASPGSPVEESGNAPFEADGWLFSLNGVVHGHHDGVGDALRSRVTARRQGAIEGVADSTVVFALVLDALDRGEPPGPALAGVVELVESHTTGRLNLLLTDGRRIAATAAGGSLFVRARDDAVVVASEPLDHEPGWDRVPDRSLVEVDGDVRCRPLGTR